MSTFDDINRKMDDREWAVDMINFINDLSESFDENDQSDPVKNDLRHRLSNLRHRLHAYRDGTADSTKTRAQLKAMAQDAITRYSKVMKKPLPAPPAPSDDEGQDGPAPAGFAPLKKRVDTGFKHLGFDEDGNPTDDGWFAKVNNLGMTVVGEDGESGLVGRVKALENAPSADKEAVRKLDERVTALENTPATGASSFNQKAAGLTAAVVIVLTLIVSIIAPFSWLHNIVLWIAGLSLAGIAALVVGYWPAKKNEVHS